MAKSKNHTAQNQCKKDHKNGIQRARKNWHSTLKGRDPKFLRNLRYAKKHQIPQDKEKQRQSEAIHVQYLARQRARADSANERKAQAAQIALAIKTTRETSGPVGARTVVESQSASDREEQVEAAEKILAAMKVRPLEETELRELKAALDMLRGVPPTDLQTREKGLMRQLLLHMRKGLFKVLASVDPAATRSGEPMVHISELPHRVQLRMFINYLITKEQKDPFGDEVQHARTKLAPLELENMNVMRSPETPGVLSTSGHYSCVGRRINMEDTVTIKGDLLGDGTLDYYAVFDGHSGPMAANIASNCLHTKLADLIRAGKPIEEALTVAFEETHQTIVDEKISSGCTAAICLVSKDHIYAANAGDARVVLVRKGTGLRLTKDHKPTDEQETMRIRKLGGAVLNGRVNGRLAVSRALGDSWLNPFVTYYPYVTTTPREAEDTWVVVACDGIWDVMSDDDAAALVYGKTPEEAAKALVDSGYLRESTDNMSVVTVKLNG